MYVPQLLTNSSYVFLCQRSNLRKQEHTCCDAETTPLQQPYKYAMRFAQKSKACNPQQFVVGSIHINKGIRQLGVQPLARLTGLLWFLTTKNTVPHTISSALTKTKRGNTKTCSSIPIPATEKYVTSAPSHEHPHGVGCYQLYLVRSCHPLPSHAQKKMEDITSTSHHHEGVGCHLRSF
ncbi:unnamed protein product [Ectocarpus sp. 8 AP-2014]